MNALIGLMILAGILYGILVDGTFWKIYSVLVTLYLIFVLMYREKRTNVKRKTILMSTWDRKLLLYIYLISSLLFLPLTYTFLKPDVTLFT